MKASTASCRTQNEPQEKPLNTATENNVDAGTALQPQALAALMEACPGEVSGAVWLVTLMNNDAEAGRFGDPVVLPIECLSKTGWLVNSDKVERFKGRPDVLTKPVLIEQNEDGQVGHVFDGRHRLTALIERGVAHFCAWVVPAEKVRDYMISPELIAGAVALLAEVIRAEEEQQQ
jgi:hypothetical protein